MQKTEHAAPPLFRPQAMNSRRFAWMGSTSPSFSTNLGVAVLATTCVSVFAIANLVVTTHAQMQHFNGIAHMGVPNPAQARAQDTFPSSTLVEIDDRAADALEKTHFARLQAATWSNAVDVVIVRIERQKLQQNSSATPAEQTPDLAEFQWAPSGANVGGAIPYGTPVSIEVRGAQRSLFGWLTSSIGPEADR